MTFPINTVRARFPALAIADGVTSRAYLDAPGGTQVCADAIEAMRRHLENGTANDGGTFATSRAVGAQTDATREAVADLINAEPSEIAFGPNMTSLTFAVSRALARDWDRGDEIVVTRLDHDANVAPWLEVAADRGLVVRWLDFDPASGELCLDTLPGLLGERTRVVAVGGASNALGTINDVATIVREVRARSSALVHVDAVQLAPHVLLDVAAINCDLLTFSPYKMFGPHIGVLWCRSRLTERLSAYKVRPAATAGAKRFETGTPSFEAHAGLLATIGYLEWLGTEVAPAATDRRARLVAAFAHAEAYERTLGEKLLDGLGKIAGVRLYGPPTMEGRLPTFAFTIAGHAPRAVAEHLADQGIFVWSGHFYAVEAIERLGLSGSGGLVRVGLCHYNTVEEVDRLVSALAELA